MTDQDDLSQEEQLRDQQLRKNYPRLNTQYKKLQEDYQKAEVMLREEVTHCLEIKARMEQLQKENQDLREQIEDLKSQTGPAYQRRVREEISKDIVHPMQVRTAELEAEVDHYRSSFNTLRQDHLFLKTEFEHTVEQHVTIIKELKMQHDTEVAALHKERESYLTRQKQELVVERERMKELQRENIQLNRKIQELVTEVEELRAHKEVMMTQGDLNAKLQEKQLVELKSLVQTITAEKDSQRGQIDTLGNDLARANQQNSELTSRIHQLEQENVVARNKADELSHQINLEVSNVKMEAAKERSAIQRDHDLCEDKLKDLRAEVAILREMVNSQKLSLAEKDLEMASRVQASREEEWAKLQPIQSARLELEARVNELERQKVESENALRSELQRAGEQLTAAHKENDRVDREAVELRAKLSHLEVSIAQLHTEKTEKLELQSRVKELSQQVVEYVNAEHRQKETQGKLQEQLTKTQTELDKVRAELRDSERTAHQLFTADRLSWETEKSNLQRRLDELQTQAAEARQRAESTSHNFDKFKSKSQRVLQQMKGKLKASRSKESSLKTENDNLRSRVPKEEYERVLRRLRELLHNHREFSGLLATEPTAVTIGNRSFSAVLLPQGGGGGGGVMSTAGVDGGGVAFQGLTSSSPVQLGQGDLNVNSILQRLDRIRDDQREQMDLLSGLGGAMKTVQTSSSSLGKGRRKEKRKRDVMAAPGYDGGIPELHTGSSSGAAVSDDQQLVVSDENMHPKGTVADSLVTKAISSSRMLTSKQAETKESSTRDLAAFDSPPMTGIEARTVLGAMQTTSSGVGALPPLKPAGKLPTLTGLGGGDLP